MEETHNAPASNRYTVTLTATVFAGSADDAHEIFAREFFANGEVLDQYLPIWTPRIDVVASPVADAPERRPVWRSLPLPTDAAR